MFAPIPAQVNWYSADARYGHAIAGGANLVLFGGTTDGAGPLGDTWVRGNTGGWVRQSATTGPTAVFNHDMALESTSTDAAARVVVFGGRRALGAAGLSDQTWVWDGVRWGSGGVAPLGLSPRERHAMVLDRARDRVVLCGGAGSAGGALADTWEWTGVQWEPRASGPARLGHALVFDHRVGRTDACSCLVAATWGIAMTPGSTTARRHLEPGPSSRHRVHRQGAWGMRSGCTW